MQKKGGRWHIGERVWGRGTQSKGGGSLTGKELGPKGTTANKQEVIAEEEGGAQGTQGKRKIYKKNRGSGRYRKRPTVTQKDNNLTEKNYN